MYCELLDTSPKKQWNFLPNKIFCSGKPLTSISKWNINSFQLFKVIFLHTVLVCERCLFSDFFLFLRSVTFTIHHHKTHKNYTQNTPGYPISHWWLFDTCESSIWHSITNCSMERTSWDAFDRCTYTCYGR